MSRNRLLLSVTLILLGLAVWTLVGPYIIGLGGEKGSFVSLTSWLGLSVSMVGVALVFFGIGEVIV